MNNLKVFFTDIDGVWTERSMYYSENGDELKDFILMIRLEYFLKEVGIETVIITSEDTKIVKKRAKKLGIEYVFQGCQIN